MRKLTFMMLVVLLLAEACGPSTYKTTGKQAGYDDQSMFVEVEETWLWKVVYHKDTKVMYAVSYGSYNQGVFTLLVDAEGKPLIYKGDTYNEQY